MKTGAKKEDNLIALLSSKFLPYWPLFLVLLIISVGCAMIYLQYATPREFHQLTPSQEDSLVNWLDKMAKNNAADVSK